MDERNVTIDRQSLYEEMWSDPMTVVAQRYGLSDVGLAKICRKLFILVPWRGYWAKLAAGRTLKRKPVDLHHGSTHLSRIFAKGVNPGDLLPTSFNHDVMTSNLGH